ncbi:MAG: hypothetical protein LQ349_002852 [Xanthoria aureola]|nr:MAG: hypothetical protein LQ349_002852 [Xanthoria aureola]
MEALGGTVSVVQLVEFTIKTIKYLYRVKEASNERTGLLREAQTLLTLLLSLQAQVDKAKQSEAWFVGIESLTVKNGPLDQLRDGLENLTDKLRPEKGMKTTVRKFVWTLDTTYCEDLLQKIERAKSSINLALQGDTFKVAQAIKADTAGIGKIDQRVTAVSQSLERLHIEDDVKKRQEILAWFSPLNFFKTQQDVFGRREDGTGQWLIESPTFQNWLSGSHPTLCCTGIPGAGKSILASAVVDYLRKAQPKTSAIGVAAVYCNFKERQMQTPENLLAGVCAQLAETLSGPLPIALVDIYRSHSRLDTRPTLIEILKVLESTVDRLDTAYLVIDALDECSEQVRNVLLTRIDSLAGNTRVLVTTRHVDDIVNRYREIPKIEIRATEIDLTNYITSRIVSSTRLTRTVRDHPALEQEICERVISKADGMFLVAKLHVDALSTKGNVKTLKEALRNLPTTLDELYDEAVQRINFQNQDDKLLALKALRWVAYTYRPLSFRMLQQALAIELGQVDFDKDSMHPIGLVIDVCAGLLIADSENKVVRLVHYTTQSYLDSLLTSRFQDAHSFIASDCITYMSYDTLQSEDPRPEYSSSKYSSRESMYPFWNYASTFWTAHAMARQSSELKAQVQRYLASNPWVCLISPVDYERPWLGTLPQRCPGYGVAAFYGLYDELEFFLRDTVNINSLLYKSHLYDSRPTDSALHLAARNNQIETLRLLLDHGADIEISNLSGMTPLMVAVGHKHLTVVRELISRGANVMAEDSQNQISFQKVKWSSSIPFLQYLVAAGTILERRHLFNMSALMCRISSDNDIQTSQWLFESALKDPDRTLIPSDLLPWAATCEAEPLYLINKLLDCGADVNSTGYVYDSALHSACESGNFLVIKVLLERGIDVNIRNLSGMVALHLAAESGDDEVVEALITSKSALNVQDSEGSTPLIAAVKRNKTSTALLLLQHGADVNFQDRKGMTALHWASAQGNLEILQKLMEHKASAAYKSLFTLVAKPMDPMSPGSNRIASEFGSEDNLIFYTCRGVAIKLFRVDEPSEHRISTGRDAASVLWRGLPRVEWKIWRQGMTALDIALLHGNKQIISLLASDNISEGQADAIPRDEYLCKSSGLTPLHEVLKNERRKRRIEKGEDQEQVSDTTSTSGESSKFDEP